MALQDSISQVLTTKFTDTVYELASQSKARTRPMVEMEVIQSEDVMFPRIGTAEVQLLNERFPEIIPADIQWDNRRLTAGRFGLPLFTDKWDAERMLADPNSVLAKRAAEALERHFDRVVLDAILATVFTGRNGTVPVTAAADGVIAVDATGGLTYETLLQIDANFQSVEVGTEAPINKWLLISEQEHQQLMKEGTLINGDFSNQYVVDKGGMKHAMGFDIVMFGSKVPIPMLQVAGGVRKCLAVASGAMKVGLTQGWEIDVEKRNDRWKTTQILASGIMGAVRMEGVRIQEIDTLAT